MPRRVSLPGASELFRSTTFDQESAEQERATEQERETAAVGAEVTELKPSPPGARESETKAPGKRGGTGRVRHEEKITVYVSSDELIALESARLRMRAEFGSAVDRGRIVREAVSIAMADLAAHGAGSELAKRLSAT